jgi:recombination protein RecA
MVVRRKTRAPEQGEGGLYFSSENSKLQFFSSGCTVLDEVLGGGWVLGRVCNVVGDKAVGKTLLAIEAAANFSRSYPTGRVFYAEVESAFDPAYARCVGLPEKRIRFPQGIDTVEDWYEDIERRLDQLKGLPGLYIIDSLDALSDRAELDRAIGDSTYGAQKAKKMSEMFRRLTRKLADGRMCVMVISQVRDKIDARAFGRKFSRSGGRALDFYASQVLYLANLGLTKRTIQGVERAIGVQVSARADKNKVGWPYRDCEFEIVFGYGIDDVAASVEFLSDVGRLDVLGDKLTRKDQKGLRQYIKSIHALPREDFQKEQQRLRNALHEIWKDIELKFRPPHSKYGVE